MGHDPGSSRSGRVDSFLLILEQPSRLSLGPTGMTTLAQDIRFAIRTLFNKPGFALACILTIALGIGANSAIFSLVNGVLLRPLPLHQAEQLVTPEVIAPTGFEISLSIPNFRDWRERSRSFESFAANARRSRTLTGGERPEVVVVRLILGDFFETLGVQPALGRWIPSDETWAGAEPKAVVSHGFWQRRMGGEAGVLGSKITLNGRPFEVVGVMPAGFAFPSADTEVFVPMGFFSEQMCWETRDCSQGTWAIARLREGVSIEQAQTDLERISRELAQAEGQEVAVARLVPLKTAYVGDIQAHIWILMAAVAFVLLIACANVAGLLLARGERRRRELAIRSALGAGRGRVVRQLLTESLVLATAGGLLGVLLAFAGIQFLLEAVRDRIPSVLLGRIALDPSVLLFTLCVTLLVGLLFGVAPALRASRSDPISELKEGGRGAAGNSRHRLRAALVSGEVALSLVLLIGAGLMIRSLGQLQAVDKGFVAENVFSAEVSLPQVRYGGKDQVLAFHQRLLERVEALPGAQAVSLANIVPLEGNSWERGIWPEGVPIERETVQSVLFYIITPKHFEVMGIPILSGRTFDERDREGADLVCIIDQSMADKFWPGEDPIGKRVTFESSGDSHHGSERIYRTVIGVARNVRHYELENPSRIQLYVPMQQSGDSWASAMTVLVKTQGDPLSMTEPVRREVLALDAEVPLQQIETLEGYLDNALSGTRLVGVLLSIFSALALLLSALGIFGVMSFSVAQRLPEIGIRMALGARSADVVRMVAGQGMGLTLAGAALGLAAALGLTRLMGSLLFQVDPLEPLTYAGTTAFLFAVASLAAYLPARRASRVDPTRVMREE